MDFGTAGVGRWRPAGSSGATEEANIIILRVKAGSTAAEITMHDDISAALAVNSPVSAFC